VPEADITHCGKERRYSITSSAMDMAQHGCDVRFAPKAEVEIQIEY
jgi:hypothetical protein